MTTPSTQAGKRAAYSAYKPSGVEWLGDVPEHWSPVRLRYRAQINPSRSELNGTPGTLDVSFVPMESVREYGGLSLDQTRPLAEVATGYTYFRDGDVLAAKITPCFENGKGAIAQDLLNGIGFGTTELHVLRPSPSLDRHFLFYVTISHAFRYLGAAEMYGAGGQKRVPEDFFKDFRQPIPSLDEQRTIAVFLDRETARIDALIAKKWRQIELLQEKRSALISHAVTKGLNPNAPMKDSGIEWLGQIPKHWAILPLKHLARIGNGSTPSRENMQYWVDGSFPWLNSSVVNQTHVTEGSDFVTDLALRECHLPRISPPTVVVGITGEGKTRGMATLVEIECTINQHLAFIKPKYGAADAAYIRNLFSPLYGFLRSESSGGGSTKGAITCEQLANLKVPCPPMREQTEIVERISRELLQTDALVRKVEHSIDLIREHRTALISAAVTGRIDVREVNPS